MFISQHNHCGNRVGVDLFFIHSINSDNSVIKTEANNRIFCVIKKTNNHFSQLEKCGFGHLWAPLALLNSSELSQQRLKIKIPWIRGMWRKNTLYSQMTGASSQKELNRYQLSSKHVDQAKGSIRILLVSRLILGANPPPPAPRFA